MVPRYAKSKINLPEDISVDYSINSHLFCLGNLLLNWQFRYLLPYLEKLQQILHCYKRNADLFSPNIIRI